MPSDPGTDVFFQSYSTRRRRCLCTGSTSSACRLQRSCRRCGRLPRLQRKIRPPIRRRATTFCVQRVDGPGVSELDQPYGLLTPAQQEAFLAKLYMHKYGATSADFGQISVLSRKHAANNPKAWFYERPITIEDHQNSRMIADPIRLLDCCQESDGGQALVIVSAERARDLPHKPVVISGAAQGVGPQQISMSSYYRDDIDSMPEVELVARQLWDQAGIGPDDIDAAILYDAFTPMVLLQLEEYGFCGRGEAKDFIADGNLELDGRLPINTHGGQLGEGYIHGVNGIAEGVRLIRGTSTNQPTKTLDNVLVTGGSPVPHSALVLSADR